MRSILPLFAFAIAASAPAVATEVVPLPHFDSVELRGGGEIIVVPGPLERVTMLEGSTEFTRFRVERGRQLKIDTCDERCPHLYRMRIQIESPRVPDLAISGGGLMSVQGAFRPQSDLSVAISGGGKIDARSVEASNVSAAVNGGGDLLVHARFSLSAALNGGGTIRYSGNPAVTSAIHGGGHVRPGF